MSVMPTLPHRNIDGLTLDRWAKSFQEDITNVVYALANAGSAGGLNKYVLFVEDRFAGRLDVHFKTGIFKEAQLSTQPTIGKNTFTFYTSEGPLEVKRTGAPLAGYVNEKPWYFAVQRKFSTDFSSSTDILKEHVRDELMLYMEAFTTNIRPEQVLPIYTSVKLAHNRQQEYHFGQMMPGALQGKDIVVEYHPAEIGNLWFMPLFHNYSTQKAVNPAGKLVRREGEW